MQHYMKRRGYVFLFISLFFGMTLAANIAFALMGRSGFDAPTLLIAAVKAGLVFTCAYFISQRFLAIERRAPTGKERDFFTMVIFFIMLVLMILAVLGGSGKPDEENMTPYYKTLGENAIIAVYICAATFASLYLNLGVLARRRFKAMRAIEIYDQQEALAAQENIIESQSPFTGDPADSQDPFTEEQPA